MGPEQVAEVLRRENLADVVVLNQAEDRRLESQKIRELLPVKAFLGSLQQGWME